MCLVLVAFIFLYSKMRCLMQVSGLMHTGAGGYIRVGCMRRRETHIPTWGFWGKFDVAGRGDRTNWIGALYSAALGDHFGTKNGVFRVLKISSCWQNKNAHSWTIYKGKMSCFFSSTDEKRFSPNDGIPANVPIGGVCTRVHTVDLL